MKRLFAATFFFFAYLNFDDAAHRDAKDYFRLFDDELVTTEWVLTELADGLSRVSNRETFVAAAFALNSQFVIVAVE